MKANLAESTRIGARSAALPYVCAAIVALIGLADAIYLTAEHIAGRSVKCLVVSGCDEVLASQYAALPGGVPLAALGAAAYFVVFSLATLIAFGHGRATRPLLVIVGLMAAMTLWLLYLQAFVLRAYCAYCLLSAILTGCLALLVFGPLLIRRNTVLN